MDQTGRILLVDDDAPFRTLCARWLRTMGHEVDEAGDPKEALQQFRMGKPELVLLDLVMPPEHAVSAGLAMIPHFRGVPVIVTTGHADRDNGLKAIEAGAWDFLGKPVEPELLRVVIGRALVKSALERENLRLRELNTGEAEMGILGVSPTIVRLKELIRRIAATNISVLILGPSGTGKELAARALHECSPRRGGPFVPVHCGAIPAELLENELFGHVRGGFTGADRDRAGLIESAARGTLFLDEIGEMSPSMQVKLLRVLQEGRFRPVGSQTERVADVRVICATHRDLERMVQTGTFREDLYYRIKGVVLRTPALEERLEDLPLLAQACLNRIAGSQGEVLRLSAGALSWLMTRSWPGNVRELHHLLHAAAALVPRSGKFTMLEAADLQFAHSGGSEPPELIHDLDLTGQVTALERRLIVAALAETGHNQNQAARRLGISRVGLWKKMKRLQISLGRVDIQ